MWKSLLGKAVLTATGPAPGTAAAEIQDAWLAGAAAGRRHDKSEWEAARARMVAAAEQAGYAEVIAAISRFDAARDGSSDEPLERAVKPLTAAVHALPFRPNCDSTEGRLLAAWARWDMSLRGTVDDDDTAVRLLTMLQLTAVAAGARDVMGLLGRLDQAAHAGHWRVVLATMDEIGAAVYRRAYHREPPPDAFPWAGRGP